jgi:DNA-binding CsgD family transcriptional regulator
VVGRDGDDLDRLIARLYEAGLSGDAPWQPVVQGLVDVLRARTGWLVVRPAQGGVSQILGSVGAGTEAAAAYQDHYWAKDPWLDAIRLLPAGGIFASHDTIDDRGFAHTEIFADYVHPHFGNTTWCTAVSLAVADGTLATFSVHRLRAAGAFTPQETQRLNRLVPHLRQALLLRHRVGSLTAERDRALGVLAAGQMAAIVLDAAGRTHFASPVAEMMLRPSDGLRLTAGGLRAATPAQQDRLDRAIARAADPAVREGTMLRLSRPSGADDWIVLIAPFATAGSPHAGAREVLCLIRDPDRDLFPPARHLMGAFGLTAAEARLAGALARGLRPDEIAARHGVSLATVRKQLSAVLAKTGCARQADLLRLVLTLPQA